MEIYRIQTGDVIESYNVQTNKLYPNVVIDTLKYSANTLYTINGQVTSDGFESFYTNNSGTYEWIAAKDLKVGESILDPQTNKYITIHIITIQNLSQPESVYDIIGATGNDYIIEGGYLADKVA